MHLHLCVAEAHRQEMDAAGVTMAGVGAGAPKAAERIVAADGADAAERLIRGFIAGVRRGRQEHDVSRAPGELAHGGGALRCRGHLMRLVDDDEVPDERRERAAALPAA